MKNLIVIILCLSMSVAVFSQTASPVPDYDYAILRASDLTKTYIVQYSSNANQTHLEDILKINKMPETFTFTQARMLCIKYMNEQGYELTSSSGMIEVRGQYANEISEYVFKRSAR